MLRERIYGACVYVMACLAAIHLVITSVSLLQGGARSLVVAALAIARPAGILQAMMLLSFGVVSTIGITWTICWVASLFYRTSPPKQLYRYPKLSVIVPAHNEERVIRNLLGDLRGQTYVNIEVLVVCHNCGDATDFQARVVASEDDRIRVLSLNTVESGKALALNYGLRHATGEFVFVFDADNRLPENAIERAATELTQEGVDAVQMSVWAWNSTGWLPKMQALESYLFLQAAWRGMSSLGIPCFLHGTGTGFRRSALERIGGWDNLLAEDYALLQKLLRRPERGRIVYVPDASCYDEKPTSWVGLFRQRARWVRGHLQVARRYAFRPSGVLIHDLLLFNPLHLYAWWVVILGSLYGRLAEDPSLGVIWPLTGFAWLVSIAVTLVLTGAFARQRWWQTVQYFVFAFNYYWAAVFALRVRSWADAKTLHYGSLQSGAAGPSVGQLWR